MTDLSAARFLNVQGADTPHATLNHLLAVSTACSQCASLLAQAPSLREVAFERLSSFMRGNTRVWNPDIIFLNIGSESGAVQSSCSLTDALVQAMLSGTSAFDQNLKALYHRHDSIDAQHLLAADDFTRIKSAFDQVLMTFDGAYQGALAWGWDRQTSSADGGHSASRHQLVSEQHRLALEHEIEFEVGAQRLDNDDKRRLLHVLNNQPGDGLFKVFVRLANGVNAPLLSVFMVASDEQTTEAPQAQGACYLVMPAGGIERYGSFSELNRQLARRLGPPSGEQSLQHHLYLSDLSGLPADYVFAETDLTYESCVEPMLHCHLQALRSKQARDFDSLVEQARANNGDYQTFLKSVADVQVCAHVDQVMGRRFHRLAQRAEQKAQPHWLKYADPDKREHYAMLDRQYRERRLATDAQLVGVESLEVFARNEVEGYIRRHLGYSVDPQQVMISLPDAFDIKGGAFKLTYRKSLLEFAMQGLPAVAGSGQLTIPVANSNPSFTFAFVKTMLDELDVQRRYRQQLRARLTSETTLRAITHRRDSALALSVWAASLQGHLADDRSQALIHRVRGDHDQTGAALTLGSLTLAANGARFKDVLVFRDSSTAGDHHYVLYAPGAPGARDVWGFNTWRHLALEVGSWLAADAGVNYVRDQTATTSGTDYFDFLERVRVKGTLWNQASVVFNELEGRNFEERLSGAVRHKVERSLAIDDAALLGLTTQTSYANQGLIALLDHRVGELNQAFMHTTHDLVSFEQFARREGSQLLTDYMHKQGVSEHFDTDTIYVDLSDKAAHVTDPDFSEYTSLRSLTSLFMEGYSGNYAFKPGAPMYSSVGQDLQWLPDYVDEALQNAAFGERYIKWIEDEFLDPQHAQYAYRKALFGKRLQLDMRSAAMREFLNGNLSAKQYQWLTRLIVSLDKTVLEKDRLLQSLLKRSRASMFRYGGYVVQGVYMLRNFSTSDGDFNLLYTPNAPDGISFRKLTDYVKLMRSPEMRRYYYLRVPYKGQPSVGTLFDNMDRNIPTRWVEIENQEHQNTDQISDVHELYDAQVSRIISDVDDQTESTAERWGLRIYQIVRMLGTVLLMPFPGASLAWTVLHLAVDLQQGLLAYRDGDRAAASWFFGSAVWGSLSVGLGVKTVLAGEKPLIHIVANWTAKNLHPRTLNELHSHLAKTANAG
ncbi:DUF6543 domain-containing protein [Xanthomonas sp. WHRI 1810A]|uniref:dermonecrotic toxin domain-containing protein n=1 Tax=Xanthomonas sp. WHRI 1810A TaxID=3161565 RepID=UPI0032E85F48